ncbi:multifunctional CCA tRNA nucleotidyl transferase/2'3'-cyclic phosphodiesterase/2'nucleotidase/phosphatase [Marinobacter litoralis]|uniref:multifunctional CCA tRNA nucleotidyl transferase/2'3'-cyclic phosphodiesterase/2'nucleotidase/phosphatase n=1 Tax=Marinobacter litoralis TaxID=187981 RepID=UPI0018EDA1F3|nr:multifunctional CCA tRNA nucleotidyl transferase/2'3'-cyclic phosphodiesterase/2'nucleotidase/phosphatase [Marinobacter litoralis]MBJ6136922.1 multifunctional CCA tRNA nucleotidyl transferase/2'3'-cyclic phosphodiesterase/2'nucleotidase/phosphatase [Marinobacter litoralis]
MDIYLVGGAVRDGRLGIPVKDRDWVVVGATPEAMTKKGYRQVGADFPVFLHPETGEEYALARTERKQGRGYHGFTVYSAPDVTLEEDLKRRDLTINAMAEREDGTLVDPFNGSADLEQKTLRHVSEAFAEDPLRILRTARFAARFHPLGFTICTDTMALMREMIGSGELEHLVPERVWQEVQRALHEKSPTVFFKVLHELGALDILMPELANTGCFNAGLQALQCMSAKNNTTAQRFAALLSALPEPEANARAVAMKSPNDCRDLTRLVCLSTDWLSQHNDAAPPPESVLDMFDQTDLWRRPERFELLLATLTCTPQQQHVQPLKLAAESAKDVNPQDLLKQGFKGKELGNAIRSERLTRITQALAP